MGRPRSGLTDKQRLFAHTLASGKYSISDAYREVYSAGNMSGPAVRVEASRLAANPNVSLMVEKLRGEMAVAERAMALSDRDRVLEKLRTWMDHADATDGNKLRAAELLGKSVGLFKDVTISTDSERSSNEVAAEIERKLENLIGEAESAQDLLPGKDGVLN